MANIDDDLEILRTSTDDVASIIAALGSVLKEMNSPQRERMFAANKMDAYVKALTNNIERPTVVALAVKVFQHIKDNNDNQLLLENGVYPLLIDCLKVDTNRATAHELLDIFSEENTTTAKVRYYRTTAMLEKWGEVLLNLPRGDELKKPLFNTMEKCLVEYLVAIPVSTTENLQYITEFTKRLNEGHLKSGEFDVYAHHHLQKPEHYFWDALNAKVKEANEKLKGHNGIKYEILEIVGHNLAPKDINGLSDPYVEVHHAGKKVWKSAVQKKNLNPHWEYKLEPIHIITKCESEEHNLEVCIWDKDLIGQDFMGQCALVTSPLLALQESHNNQEGIMLYLSLYGSKSSHVKGTIGIRYRTSLL